MHTLTVYQPAYAADQGQPYVVRITTGAGTIDVPCWTAIEAWDVRDAALDEGHTARILGLPCRVGACGFPTHQGPLPSVED